MQNEGEHAMRARDEQWSGDFKAWLCPIRWWMSALLLAAMSFAHTVAVAEDVALEDADARSSSASEAEDWSVGVAPYLWLPQIQGTLSTRGVTAVIDLDYHDLFDLLGNGDLFAAGVHLEGRYRKLSFLVDDFGGTARPQTSVKYGPNEMLRGRADVTFDFNFLEFGPAYRVVDLPVDDDRSIIIDLLTGGRFMYFHDSISVLNARGNADQKVNATTTWVDPFVGGRWWVPVSENLDVIFRGDIGGFGAGSQLAWNLVGGFQYELPWSPGGVRTSIAAIYKAFDFNYATGSASQKTVVALNLRGPALGLTFEF